MRGFKVLFLVVLALSLLLGGCMGYKEQLRATDNAIEQARSRGAYRSCPDDLQGAIDTRDIAVQTWLRCSTEKGMEGLRLAEADANELCEASPPPPPPPLIISDTDGDGVLDPDDQCPGTPLGATVDSRGCWVLKDVRFDTDMWNIKGRFVGDLNEVVDVMRKNPGLKIEIQGHTDNRGSAEHNEKLSANRAKAVLDYIAERGISRGRMTSAGYGFNNPAATNSTEEGMATNRRVEIKPIR